MSTIFDLHMEAFSAWSFPVGGLVFALAGFLFLWAPDFFINDYARQTGRSSSFTWLVRIGLIFCISTFAYITLPYLNEIALLRSHAYQAVEGPLTNYKPGTIHPVTDEEFTVRGINFKVKPYAPASFGGFSRTKLTHPEGTYVRILYDDNMSQFILRIEAHTSELRPAHPNTLNHISRRAEF